jgi:hypothetical protein
MDSILVASINRYLEDHYGKLTTGETIFKVEWTTGLTEKRFSEYTDFYDETPIRTVKEVRQVLKYPFAQDRYVLERIVPISESARQAGLAVDGQYSYEEVYLFQDRLGQYLPLTLDKVEQALYLFFVYYLQKTPKERTDLRMEMLGRRELAKKELTRELVDRNLRSPFFIGVIE